MNLAHFFWSHAVRSSAPLLVLLVVLSLVCTAAPIAAASANEAAIGAPAAVLMGNFFNDIIGNRTRMIQVACVLGAIGIFVLTRSYR